jgi:hypothetical protein
MAGSCVPASCSSGLIGLPEFGLIALRIMDAREAILPVSPNGGRLRPYAWRTPSLAKFVRLKARNLTCEVEP